MEYINASDYVAIDQMEAAIQANLLVLLGDEVQLNLPTLLLAQTDNPCLWALILDRRTCEAFLRKMTKQSFGPSCGSPTRVCMYN